MNERIAIIDLGTNTFHLLVTEGMKTIHEERRAVRIGLGGINKGIITKEGLDRAIHCLRDYRKTANSMGIDRIHAIGTSALRNATNSKEAITIISEETGIKVQIISGDREAELIYEGIRSGMNLGNNLSMIIDIGGGSVEFIIANNAGINWKQSIEAGGQRLIELFHRHDPILQDEIESIRKYLDEKLSGVLAAIIEYRPKVLIGSSGSFDTLSEIWCLKNGMAYFPSAETPLTMDGFRSISRELILKNREERMLMPGMIELRVDMIVVAVILIEHLITKAFFEQIRVSGYSLKEGVRHRILSGYSL